MVLSIKIPMYACSKHFDGKKQGRKEGTKFTARYLNKNGLKEKKSYARKKDETEKRV
jgi:hypothetical protein